MNIIKLNNWYLFNDLIVQIRSNHTHKMSNKKMKPWLSPVQFIEISIHLRDEELKLFSYKDIEKQVCDKACLHRYDNYKANNVKQCYVSKHVITGMHKAVNKAINKGINKNIFVSPNNFTLRLTLHGDINQLNQAGQAFILFLCKNASTVLGYSSDVTKLIYDFSPYVCMSSMNQAHVLLAQNLGYTVYYSGDKPDHDLAGLKDVIQCKTTTHSIGGCSTCRTPCGSSKYNVISASEDIKQNIKTLAIKQGRLQSKGITHYHFIYDLLLMALIAIRLKSLIIFWFYLFVIYFFDLINFILGLFK